MRLGRLVWGLAARNTRDEIREKLEAADEDVSVEALTDILQRLVDTGRVRQLQRAPSYPMRYASSGTGYDLVDDLESDICQVLRDRVELGFPDDETLRAWMAEAGVEYDERLFELALGSLLRLGRLQTPRLEHWQGPGPRVTMLYEAVVYRDELGP